MATPYKMKGHTLPGPNQKASPAKDFGLISGPIIAAALTKAALAKAALTAAVSTGIGKGIGAISKNQTTKKAEIKEKQTDAKIASRRGTEGITKDIGSKTKLTD